MEEDAGVDLFLLFFAGLLPLPPPPLPPPCMVLSAYPLSIPPLPLLLLMLFMTDANDGLLAIMEAGKTPLVSVRTPPE